MGKNALKYTFRFDNFVVIIESMAISLWKDSSGNNSERIWKARCQVNWSRNFLREILYITIPWYRRDADGNEKTLRRNIDWKLEKLWCCDEQHYPSGIEIHPVIAFHDHHLIPPSIRIKHLFASWKNDHVDKLESPALRSHLHESLGITWLHRDERASWITKGVVKL